MPVKVSVYVSGNDPVRAKALADKLREDDYEVLSTWHDEEGPKVDTTDRKTWTERWERNTKAIRKAGTFVQFASPGVELGYAIGYEDANDNDGKYVVVIGDRPESGMAASDYITYVPDETAFINSL